MIRITTWIRSGTPKRYAEIGQALPQADGKYVQNLAQEYIDTAKDIDEQEPGRCSASTAPDTLDKVLYATGKILDSLIPLPGMDWLAGATAGCSGTEPRRAEFRMRKRHTRHEP